jgi:UDP-N-acetylmuramyl pentapeptide phosphotransferase/UDP-N-acetylglucosamine-1-phosphate transferase
VLLSLTGYVVLAAIGTLTFSAAFFFGSIIVAAVSWLDDLFSLPPALRLAAHIFSASIFVFSAPAYAAVASDPGIFASLLLWSLLKVIWIVFLINAYNFMDGIDGIAGVQGIIAAGFWAWAFYGTASGLSYYSLVIVGALVGFLFQNWHPARAFMGDVGSAFLGFTFASMPFVVSGVELGSMPAWLLSILVLWPFVFDTLLTLARRAARRERLWLAHREHLYQLLVRSGASHSTVSILYGVFSVCSIATGFLVMQFSNEFVVSSILILLAISVGLAAAVFMTFRASLGGVDSK